jgi:hypothetical protein
MLSSQTVNGTAHMRKIDKTELTHINLRVGVIPMGLIHEACGTTGEITRDSGTITLRPIRTKFGIIRLARSHHRKNSCFEKPRYYFVTIYQIDHGRSSCWKF